MLRELGVVEQRYQAVREVLNDGASVTDVARRNGVSRQAVHEWLVKYANRGLVGLMDRSSKPQSCPHQMAPEVEARIVELRVEHPGWGPRTLAHRLALEGFDPVPGRTSIYRCLVRHGLISPAARRRTRADYKRWERSRAMELWQMDVVGGVRLVDRSESKVITGLDDHSRFCVGAFVTPRATARPTCDALALAMRRHGAPEQILTDNGKVFTNRFGSGTGEVLFDRMCRDHGIRHLLTAPRSPTTTGKVERFHKTLRREFLDGKTFSSIDDAQAQLDAWVHSYNFERPHQSLGMAVPWDRFKLAKPAPVESPSVTVEEPASVVPSVTRRVGRSGLISFAAVHYRAGVWLAGEDVTVVCEGGLVHLHHRGVLVATHARRHRLDKQAAGLRRRVRPPKAMRTSATAASVTRKVDSSGSVCFAGASYRVGSKFRRRQVQVAVVGETVEISIGQELIRS
ncbi:MAG: IS481 family transposase, partial [Actinomycetota bacterium]|nr:IS481 family transposase [Actinomycetota bacterium]